MSEPLSVDALTDSQRTALRRLILRLADTKRLLGIRFSDWLLGAPSIETGIAASSMAQDEWGHARLLYSMLKSFGEDPVEVERDRAREAYANAPAVDHEFADWAEVVAGMVVVDGAMTALLAGFAEGRFELASNRIPKMLGEEEFHRDMGLAWLRSLAGSAGRGRVTEAIRAFLPGTLAWMAPGDDAEAELAEAGVIPSGAETLERFRSVYGEAFQALGVSIETSGAGDDFDAARGRGPGAPDEETVERARGDRNRALFVE